MKVTDTTLALSCRRKRIPQSPAKVAQCSSAHQEAKSKVAAISCGRIEDCGCRGCVQCHAGLEFGNMVEEFQSVGKECFEIAGVMERGLVWR